jgi:hypothetical protein
MKGLLDILFNKKTALPELMATVRQANPYRKMAKETHKHLKCENLLKMLFDESEPGKVLLTDIMYMRYGTQANGRNC